MVVVHYTGVKEPVGWCEGECRCARVSRYRPRGPGGGQGEVVGRAGCGAGPGRGPEAVGGHAAGEEVQASQAAAGTGAATGLAHSTPQSPACSTTTLASSRSSPSSRPRAARRVPGFPQRVAPAPRAGRPLHDTVKAPGIDWDRPAEPALLQFTETPQPRVEASRSPEGPPADQQVDEPPAEEEPAGAVMATTTSLAR